MPAEKMSNKYANGIVENPEQTSVDFTEATQYPPVL
jgi:hypothetical protein